jgi:hypothetical protein
MAQDGPRSPTGSSGGWERGRGRVEIELAPQRIFALEDRLSFDEIRQRAMDKRTTAVAGGLGGLLQRPRPEDITLTGSQRRVEPFWFISGKARYVYERTRDYVVAPSAAEVREVEIAGTTYAIVEAGKGNRGFHLPVRERCREEFADELYVDGVTGQPAPEAATVRGGPATEIESPDTMAADGTVVVAPEHRASFVVRQLLSRMLRPVQADAVLEETLTLDHSDLYYRPIHAFEFHWTTKDKLGVVEIDGVTGAMRQAASLTTNITRIVSREALFDIGADTVGLLVPGGSIAVKVARAALDRSY